MEQCILVSSPEQGIPWESSQEKQASKVSSNTLKIVKCRQERSWLEDVNKHKSSTNPFLFFIFSPGCFFTMPLLPHWDKIQTGESWEKWMVAEAGSRSMGRYLEGFVSKESMQITGLRKFSFLLLPFSNIFSYLFNFMHFSVSVTGC